MGMYTGLRGKIKLKDNVLTEALIDQEFDWEVVAHETDDEVISDWATVGRCNFIPHGAVCYMPDSWDEDMRYDVKDNILKFTCSLKNYDNEISYFIENVLPYIADAWNLEEFYEESVYSNLISSSGNLAEFNTYKLYDDYTGKEIEQKPYIDVFDLELK